MRTPLLALVVLSLAACATGPSPAPETRSPPPVAENKDDAGATQAAADRKFATAARSYDQVTRNGETLYCRTERATGSKLQSYSCINEAQLRQRVQDEEALRRPRPALCGPKDPRCGGGD